MSYDSSIVHTQDNYVEDLSGTSGHYHLECEAKVGGDSCVVEDSRYQ